MKTFQEWLQSEGQLNESANKKYFFFVYDLRYSKTATKSGETGFTFDDTKLFNTVSDAIDAAKSYKLYLKDAPKYVRDKQEKKKLKEKFDNTVIHVIGLELEEDQKTYKMVSLEKII